MDKKEVTIADYMLMRCDKTISFRLPKDLYKQVEKVAKKKGVRNHALIRKWIIEGIMGEK